MVIKKKRKEVSEEPVQKKKVKSSRKQTIIKSEKDVQTVIKTEDDDQLETKTNVRKKEHLKDECLDQLKLKKKKKKKKKKKDGSELLEEVHSEGFWNVKGHLDSEPQEESEEQIKILKKKKKKVQCYSSLSLEDNQSSDVELSNCYTDGTKENELAFKKSRKNTALNLEWYVDGTKEKKKKSSFSFLLEDIQGSEESEKLCKKPHICISQEKAFTGENYGSDTIQNDGECYMRKKKRKKNKDKSDSLPLAANQKNTYGVPDSTNALRNFNKRQRKDSQEMTLTNRKEEGTTENSGSIRESKRKKRSKEACSLICEGNYSHRVPDKHLPAQQEIESEEEELSGKKTQKNINNNNKVIKKKKKKKIRKEEKEPTPSRVSLNNNNASKSQKLMLLERNKNNKESEMKQAECVTKGTVGEVLCNRNHMLCDRKRKKRQKEAPQDFAEEPGSKSKRKTIREEDVGNEALAHMDDVTIVQVKKGNCDEVSIDKVRRQALQEEIDRESGRTTSSSTRVEQDTKFGQWSTAGFQSSERQMKFFKLMGGFKKGSVPIQNVSAATNKSNMALNREGEEKLQEALKMEFDKAMDLKQHRGIGLGFQPAANKKVYIDKYATRSIKLED